jgi:hypothetical protein
MVKLLIPRTLVARIEQFGLGKELRAFVIAITNNEHPPRVYKASGVEPLYQPYQDLGLHHHHLHRDGDPLLITQHVENEIFGVALATHATYFQGDKMEWLNVNMEAIDWTEWPALKREVAKHNDFGCDDSVDDDNKKEPF